LIEFSRRVILTRKVGQTDLGFGERSRFISGRFGMIYIGYISADFTLICLMQHFAFWRECVANKKQNRWAV